MRRGSDLSERQQKQGDAAVKATDLDEGRSREAGKNSRGAVIAADLNAIGEARSESSEMEDSANEQKHSK